MFGEVSLGFRNSQLSGKRTQLMEKMTIEEMVAETRRLQMRFREVESRRWTIETYVVELLAEAGTLADSLMIQEGYRQLRPGQEIDLEDDICDILFVLIMIADYYQICLEDAYASMLRNALEKLDKRKG